MILRRASPSGFLPNIETSSDRSREFPDTSWSSVADGSRHTGGPFLLRNDVGILLSVADSRFPIMNSVPWCKLSEVYDLDLSEVQRTGAYFFFFLLSRQNGIALRKEVDRSRATRQIPDDMSHCRELSWRRVQAKSKTWNFISLRILFDSHFPIFHMRKWE